MAHRKLEVDGEDEDQFFDMEAAVGAPLQEIEAAWAAAAASIRSLLSSSNPAKAIQLALDQPLIVGKDAQQLKDKATALVIEALSATRPTDIPAIIKDLQPAQIDTLMKYIYKGMASPDLFNSALLLSWHEKAYEVGGLGSIMRVLTDRRSA